MKKAFGYIRVSTEEQAKEGISIAHQEAKIKAYAELHDLELVNICRDEGISGKDIKNRPGAHAVIDAALHGVIDAVIVYKLDRLFRNAKDALDTASQFNEAEVAFHSVTESIDTQSAMGIFFFTIMAACAEMERNLISERTTDALAYLKASGVAYNHASYGYDVVDGMLVENEEEQKIIDKIIDMDDRDFGYQGIARELNRFNVPTKKGGEWFANSVKRVLEAAS